MEETDEAVELNPMERKLKIFLKTEEEAKKDPFNYKIHNICCYVHSCTPADLISHLKEAITLHDELINNLLTILEDENDFTAEFKNDLELMKQKIKEIKPQLVSFLINCKVRVVKEQKKDISEKELELMIAAIATQECVEVQDHDRPICVPAVRCVVLALYKVMKMVEIHMKHLSQYHEEAMLKQIFVLTSYLAKISDYLFSASYDDENDVLYNPDNREDVELLLDCLDFSEPEDLQKHKEFTVEGNLVFYALVTKDLIKLTT